MSELKSSAEYMDLEDKLNAEVLEAHKSREVVEEQYNQIKRELIDLSAKRTDLIRKKHDIEVVLNKAKENIRRLNVEARAARDRRFTAKGEGL